VSEGIGNPLTKSSEVLGNFFKKHIFLRGWPIPSDNVPVGIDYATEQSAEGIG
jgi:hypothetical protein